MVMMTRIIAEIMSSMSCERLRVGGGGRSEDRFRRSGWCYVGSCGACLVDKDGFGKTSREECVAR
jgi:hypothetical protein